LGRGRFFFVRLTGRRRIGKTTLVQRALQQKGRLKVLCMQIPDSGARGVLSGLQDQREIFGIPTRYPEPANLRQFAQLIG
jgi:AAA+ ATPase superfamily predicted ATPase